MSDDTIERDAAIEPTTSAPGDPDAPSDAETPAARAAGGQDAIDLDAIERDLDAVQTALGRLADGTYWTDEITGDPIPHERLVADPLTRRA